MSPGPSAASAALLALSRKYRALAALRAQRDHPGESHPNADASRRSAARAALSALAREFPGALRELDTLGAAELDRRAGALERAAQGGPREPWMAWIDAYHAIMRATLFVKGRLAEEAPLDAEAARALAEDAAKIAGGAGGAGRALDARFVAAVAAPPQGRIGIVVLREVARLYGEPTEAVAGALFPVRRPSPYQL